MVDANSSNIQNSKITNSNQKSSSNYYGTLGTHYLLLTKIGTGISSRVYSAKQWDAPDNSRSTIFAIKISKKNYNPKWFIEEAHILRKLPPSPFLIKFYDTGKAMLTKNKSKKNYTVYYHVFEFCENSIWFDYIKYSDGKGFGEKFGRVIFTQIINGLDICHKNGIVHNDVKCENILLTSDYQWKWCDFGFSNEYKSNANRLKFSNYGTNGYFAPEVFANNSGNTYGYTSLKNFDPVKSDLFAWGVTLFIIVNGFRPFNNAKRWDNLYKKIWRRNYDGYWKELPNRANDICSRNFKELINKMFAVNPDERYNTIDEIRTAPWLLEEDVNNSNWIKMLKDELCIRRKKIEEHIGTNLEKKDST